MTFQKSTICPQTARCTHGTEKGWWSRCSTKLSDSPEERAHFGDSSNPIPLLHNTQDNSKGNGAYYSFHNDGFQQAVLHFQGKTSNSNYSSWHSTCTIILTFLWNPSSCNSSITFSKRNGRQGKSTVCSPFLIPKAAACACSCAANTHREWAGNSKRTQLFLNSLLKGLCNHWCPSIHS